MERVLGCQAGTSFSKQCQQEPLEGPGKGNKEQQARGRIQDCSCWLRQTDYKHIGYSLIKVDTHLCEHTVKSTSQFTRDSIYAATVFHSA